MKDISFPKFQFKRPVNSKFDRRCIINGIVRDYYCAAPVKDDVYEEPHNKGTFINIGNGRIYSLDNKRFRGDKVLSFYILNPNRLREFN